MIFLLRSPFGVAGVMPSSHFSLRQLSFGDISIAATNSIARRSGEGSFNGFSCKLYDFSSGKAALKTLSCSAVVIRRSEVTREIFNNNLDNNISHLGKSIILLHHYLVQQGYLYKFLFDFVVYCSCGGGFGLVPRGKRAFFGVGFVLFLRKRVALGGSLGGALRPFLPS